MNSKTKGIVAYLAIAFGLAWGLWTIPWITGIPGSDPSFQLLILPGAFAPALGCFIVRRWVTREGFADAGLRLNLRRHWGYYLFAWLYPLVNGVITVLLAVALGVGEPDFSLQRFFSTSNLPANLSSVPPIGLFPMVLTTMIQAVMITTPVVWGEEFGWRSYLQIRLFAKRPLLAAIATGLIWGVWHYPVILMGYQRYENPWLGLLLFPVFTTLLSIILGWLQLKTGSVWAASLAHGATNSVSGSLLLLLFFGGSNWTLVTVLLWIPLGVLCAWIIFNHQLNPSISYLKNAK